MKLKVTAAREAGGFATSVDVKVEDQESGVDLTATVRRVVIVIQPGDLVRTYVEFLGATLDLADTQAFEISSDDLGALIQDAEIKTP